MKDIRSIQIKLWGNVVGYISLSSAGEVLFEYEKKFKSLGFEISPFEIPLSTTTIYKQNDLSSTFNGLPGAIADCLPDSFGMKVIEEFYLKNYKLQKQEVNIIQRLLYVGDKSIGALEFIPAIDSSEDIKNEFLELRSLREEAKNVLEDNHQGQTSNIIRVGGSAGGAQAKALIDFNPKTKSIRSGFAAPCEGYIPCIIKFDGVSDVEERNVYKRLEYVYSLMARGCGISMTNTYLLEEDDKAHFIIERFDRTKNKERPCHQVSLCGLILRDYKVKQSCSYEDFFSVTSILTENLSEVINAFRICVFNIIFRNQDDHTKNFSFLMNKKGEWKLAPAYDLTYCYGYGSASTHQMTLNNKDDNFTRDDLLTIAKGYGIKKKQVDEIVEQTLTMARKFVSVCLENGLEEDFSQGVYRNFRLL